MRVCAIVREFASEGEVASQAGHARRLDGRAAGPRNLRFEEGEVGRVHLAVGHRGGRPWLAELHRKGCHSEGGCAVVMAPPNAPGMTGIPNREPGRQPDAEFFRRAYRGGRALRGGCV